MGGEEHDEVPTALALLQACSGCGIFGAPNLVGIPDGLRDLKLASRLPQLTQNIRKPKRRRKARHQHLGEDEIYDAWGDLKKGTAVSFRHKDNEDGGDYDPNLEPRTESPTPEDSYLFGNENDPNADPNRRERGANGRFDSLTSEQIQAWAQGVQAKVDFARQKNHYELYVKRAVTNCVQAMTDIGVLMPELKKQNNANWTQMAIDVVQGEIAKSSEENIDVLKRMLFMPFCLQNKTKKFVAPRRERLTLYPASKLLPIE